MQRLEFFKKFILPGGLCGAVPAIKPDPPCPSTPVECKNEVKLIRPSELPLYVHEELKPSKPEETTRQENGPREFLELGFGTVRKNIQSVIKEYSHVKDTINNTIDTGFAHSQVTLDYLREESNVLPRVGAVAIGGLTGLIFSLRGGKFKRLLYTTTGATAIAAVCYPKEAQESIHASKHYINIGYNFIYGVKPGDANQKEISWPEFPTFKVPTSFSELMNLVTESGSSLVTAVMSLINDSSNTIKDKEQTPKSTSSEKK
ncbi:MICOS complex subunit MIC27 isoform X2 [Chelonus insularis]|uniref:MICOS complex subunit MIC27 isoform X2 n=1 Tax=Chelonus insularis TaxID=460826 RepID=UPI00158B79DF|nr:MICOS complex subunit MIC27 isoform X2 [Chelonus insularis]